MVALLSDFFQLDAVLPLNIKFLFELSDELPLLTLLVHDLLLEYLDLLVSHSQVVLGLFVLFSFEALLLLMVILNFLDPNIKSFDLFSS